MRGTVFVILLLVVDTRLVADSVTYTVVPDAGQLLYALTLTNDGDTGGTLFDLFLSVSTDISNIDTSTIGTPVGWGDPIGGLLFFGPDVNPSMSFIEWVDDASGLYDLTVGNSLAGFSFLSAEDIAGPILFSVNGLNSFSPAQEVQTAPEPLTLLTTMLSTGALWLLGQQQKRSSFSTTVQTEIG